MLVPAVMSPTPRIRAALGLVAWLAALVVVVAGLHAAGAVLPGPALTDPGAWAEWGTGADPVGAAFEALRLVALALAWWSLATTVLAVAVRAAHLGGTAVASADRLALPVARHLVHGALGAGLVVTTLAGAVRPVAAAPTAAVVAPADAVGSPGGAAEAPTGGSAPVAAGTATLRRLPPDAAGTGTATAMLRRLPEAPSPPATRVVAPGEHCWAVAEAALAEAWGRSPSDAEITGYWTALVELNRSSLPDAANPDLVFPGHVLRLPPLPSG